MRTQKHCDRCGWTNHEAKDCYATKHRNGTDLPPNGNEWPTPINVKRAKDPSQEEAEEPSTIEGAKAKAKAEAVATAKRLLAKAQAMRFTTQEVE